jgi:hypothetical protein
MANQLNSQIASQLNHFIAGLKSSNDETRLKASQDLHRFVCTELREVSADDLTSFMTSLNHQIYEMMGGSRDVNERKGAILAIGRMF